MFSSLLTDESDKGDVGPGDSVSQAKSNSSRGSSTTGAYAKAAAKRAGLQARLENFKRLQMLEMQQKHADLEIRQAELEGELMVAKVEERVLNEFKEDERCSSVHGRHGRHDRGPDVKENPACPTEQCRDFLSMGPSGVAPGQSTLAPPLQSVQQLSGSPGQNSITPNLQNSEWMTTTSMRAPEYVPPVKDNSFQPAASYSTNHLQRELIDILSLPKTCLKTFDGDPLYFSEFMNAFNTAVDRSAVDDASKLTRLFEYCVGRAGKVIKPCAIMNPSEGYRRARELLKERFGNQYQISEAWLKKVTDGSQIKANDGLALQDLTDDLRCCVESLKALGRYDEINTRNKIVDVLQRLPFFMQTRWRQEAVTFLNRMGRYPNIEVLVDFLQKIATEINDPIFGSLDTKTSRKDKEKSDSSKTRPKGSSFNIQATENKANANQEKWRHCFQCGGDHLFSMCTKIQGMSSAELLENVKRLHLCYNCMNGRHQSRFCRQQSDCSCGRKHSKHLHEAIATVTKQYGVKNDTEVKSCASSVEGGKIALPVVQLMARGRNNNTVQTCALLDPGSNRSFCSTRLARNLGLSGSDTAVKVETLGCGKSVSVSDVSLEVKGIGSKYMFLPSVLVVDQFPNLRGSVAQYTDIQDVKHLQGIEVPHDVQVDILIGQDYPQALKPLEIRSAGDNEPYAVRTSLGWTVNGPLSGSTDVKSVVSNFIQSCSDTILEQKVERFWEIDNQGIHKNLPMSVDDRKVLDLWQKTTTTEGKNVCMKIPFKDDDLQFPDNRHMALKRLMSLKRRFEKNPEVFERYKHEMNELLANGYAEEVTQGMEKTAKKVWYIPHHNVHNPNKPQKFRIVFDCAAQANGASLNQRCLQGPDFMANLLGVLLRFRQGSVAAVGDIRAMFHQVKVAEEDRDVLRFHWWENGNLDGRIKSFRMTVHLFGGVWSPSCAMYALRKATENCKDPAVSSAIHHNFYVDDCLLSEKDEVSMCKLIEKVCDCLDDKSFHLTKWVSNSPAVLETIPVERRLHLSSNDKNLDMVPGEKVLGVYWSTTDDTLGVRVNEKKPVHTKRGMLSLMSSLYDPLGMTAPVLLRAKLLFQAECRENSSWDERLHPQVEKGWSDWLNEMPQLQNLKIDRCLVPKDDNSSFTYELHNFCDASLAAYGCVTYLRVIGEGGQIHCSFVLAKSKLAPMKELTIPRLELLGAVLAVKIDQTLQEEITLQLKSSTFWTDSMIVLGYIRNRTKRFKVFVANRISRIHEGSRPDQWRHVNTKSNPADHVSRGLHVDELLSCEVWSQGPAFLRLDETQWPRSDQNEISIEGDAEVKKEMKCCTTQVETDEGNQMIENFFLRYSSWYRLKRAVVWIRRFVKKLAGEEVPTAQLSVEELHGAEKAILRCAQKKHFPKERQDLMKSTQINKSSTIANLDPFLNETDGLLRVGGRLKNASITEEAKHPVILPAKSPVSRLIVDHIHRFESGHSGREHVMSSLRRRFWITRGRTVVRSVLKDCTFCKKIRCAPVGQKMGLLPEDRVASEKPAFSCIGVDCFGPFLVKRRRTTEKRYGCLFTCSSVRAIHLEMLHSLETDSFINALVRFTARRGTPEIIRSDNGTNFTGADREMKRAYTEWQKDTRLKEHLLFKGITWNFNPPISPHMGGFWERQVKTVKRLLTTVIGKQVLDDEKLETFFCEVEAIVNNRPLTYQSDDPEDLEPLSPNHLLLQRSCTPVVVGTFSKLDMYRKRWRHVQFLTENFWRRWTREYLPTLIGYQKWRAIKRNLSVGDIVIVLDDGLPRNSWPLGRVTSVSVGSDGLVRSATVKTQSSQLVRPVAKLCLLEAVE